MRLLAALILAVVLFGCAEPADPLVESIDRAMADNNPSSGAARQEESRVIARGDTMEIFSDAFANGSKIPIDYSCKGADISPQLSWQDPPEGTKSFALIVDDPDAPMGTWVHWLVKDIPKDARSIDEDSVLGAEVKNDFGRQAYGGPCPPTGTHRYLFKLYALDVETMDAKDKKAFYAEAEKHKIGLAVLMGTFTNPD